MECHLARPCGFVDDMEENFHVCQRVFSMSTIFIKKIPSNVSEIYYKLFYVFMFMFIDSQNNILVMHLQPLGGEGFKRNQVELLPSPLLSFNF
jgi:hypothetical protein